MNKGVDPVHEGNPPENLLRYAFELGHLILKTRSWNISACRRHGSQSPASVPFPFPSREHAFPLGLVGLDNATNKRQKPTPPLAVLSWVLSYNGSGCQDGRWSIHDSGSEEARRGLAGVLSLQMPEQYLIGGETEEEKKERNKGKKEDGRGR